MLLRNMPKALHTLAKCVAYTRVFPASPLVRVGNRAPDYPATPLRVPDGE